MDRPPRHTLARPPELTSCSPRPTYSAHTLRAAQAAGHLPALVLLLRLPDGQRSRAPSLLHPPDANTSTQVCSPALPPVPVAQRTYHLPCQTCFPPLASGSASGSEKAPSLAASPLCVPSRRLSTSEPVSSPVGLPCSDPAAGGLLCARRGPQLPRAGPCLLSTQHHPPTAAGRSLLSSPRARLGHVTNDEGTGGSERPVLHRAVPKPPRAPKSWGHLSSQGGWLEHTRLRWGRKDALFTSCPAQARGHLLKEGFLGSTWQQQTLPTQGCKPLPLALSRKDAPQISDRAEEPKPASGPQPQTLPFTAPSSRLITMPGSFLLLGD